MGNDEEDGKSPTIIFFSELLTEMHKKSFEYWEKVLKKILKEEWPNFRAGLNLYKDRDWWNLKFCERGSIPYGRPVSHLSTERFSLRNKAVSYWAESSDIALCETVEDFRNDENLSDQKILYFCSNDSNLSKGKHGYPQPFHISAEARILDLTNENCAFVEAVERLEFYKDGKSFFRDIVRSRDESIYPATQAIAEAALRNSYHGIIYRSVRAPVGVIRAHLLVLFDETLLKLPSYLGETVLGSGTCNK